MLGRIHKKWAIVDICNLIVDIRHLIIDICT